MSEGIINILLVEDDEVDIMNIQRAFVKNKITNPLYIARNGLEAIEMLNTEGVNKISPIPRIILLDLNMPKMGGIEFLKEIRQRPILKSVTVFVMTTSNEESDKIEAYNLNIAGYILKPLAFESFVATISKLNHYWKLSEQP